MDLTFLSATGFTAFGLVLGVQFGRWSASLFPRRARQQSGEVTRPMPAVRPAARYVDPGRVRAGVCGLDYPSFRVR